METWQTVLQMIAAAAALGTASFGLVDVSKVVRHGLPSAGFRHLEDVYAKLNDTLERALATADWRTHLKSFWIGGAPKEDQKATVRTLVRLGFSSDEAVVAELAAFARLDPARLKAVAVKFEKGTALNDADINLLGRLDATIDLRVDAAFERADQAYRNAARAWAAIVAVVLSGIAAAVMGISFGLESRDMWLALGLGLVAVPLAPVAKDLSSALSAAARVAGSAKSG